MRTSKARSLANWPRAKRARAKSCLGATTHGASLFGPRVLLASVLTPPRSPSSSPTCPFSPRCRHNARRWLMRASLLKEAYVCIRARRLEPLSAALHVHVLVTSMGEAQTAGAGSHSNTSPREPQMTCRQTADETMCSHTTEKSECPLSARSVL